MSWGLPPDLTGFTFGKLKALRRTPTSGKNSRWLCICLCGGIREVLRTGLVSGRTRSCGRTCSDKNLLPIVTYEELSEQYRHSVRRQQDIEKRRFKKSATARASRLLREYGISVERYDKMPAAQMNRCAICSTADELGVDHCHTTGEIRGLLCGRCNKGLGHFVDAKNRIYNAIKYLRNPPMHTLRPLDPDKTRRLVQSMVSARQSHIKNQFGLLSEVWAWLYHHQAGVCAICRLSQIEAVDHDHETGLVRGLTCTACNSGIGAFKDDPGLLRRAIKYLDGLG